MGTISALFLHILHSIAILSKVADITTDSGEEMAPAMRAVRSSLLEEACEVSEDWHIPCVCLILNCIIRDSESTFTKKVRRIRELQKLVRARATLREQFRPLQIALVLI